MKPRRRTTRPSGRKRTSSTTIVGWVENVELPRLGATAMPAKLDTGAETCSLHATGIVVSGKRVSFTAAGTRHRLRLKGIRPVKSSNGEETSRPVVDLELRLNGRRDVVEFTLADRGSMRFPVLLGRNYLQNGYLVDAGFTHLVSAPDSRRGRR